MWYSLRTRGGTIQNLRFPIAVGEYYHVYNRGVDKRTIFEDDFDVQRFLQSMREFNVVEPIGSLHELSVGGPTAKHDKLVHILAYCLNPNHFHFILKEIHEGGISEYMKRLGGGYTWYFNNKCKRSGALFQGKYKYKHIDSDEYLRYLTCYVNLNDKVHKFGGWTAKSSHAQFKGEYPRIGDYKVDERDFGVGLFGSFEKYEKECMDLLKLLIQNKEEAAEYLFEE